MRVAAAGMSGHADSGWLTRWPGHPTGWRRERTYMACQNDPSTCGMGETGQSSCSPYSGLFAIKGRKMWVNST